MQILTQQFIVHQLMQERGLGLYSGVLRDSFERAVWLPVQAELMRLDEGADAWSCRDVSKRE